MTTLGKGKAELDARIDAVAADGGTALYEAARIDGATEYMIYAFVVPLVRPALQASCFGYSLGGLSITFDIGRYWNMWHIFTPGWANPTSIMFEVAVCIAAYCCVLWLEFTPVIAEKWGTPKIRRRSGSQRRAPMS